MDPIDRQCILKAMALSPLPPLLVLRRAHPVSCDGVCVPAVSGITSAVYSVGRSVLAAALLHAFCFSAVKVSMLTTVEGTVACANQCVVLISSFSTVNREGY